MSKRELEQAIKERDQAKADLEAWRTQCDSLTDTANKATQRAEKLRAELAQLKADTAAGNDELEKLKHENETLQTSLEMEKRNSKDSYDDAVEAQRKLCEERDKYEEQIKALKEAQEGTENEELKRLQVETAARAGRIKALEKELEDLKNAQQAAPPAPPEKTPEEKAFARHFENAKAEFNSMIDTVDEMPEDLRAKYKAAMKQLMEVMTALVKEA
jgi:chromosome segregation ATPase